MDWARTPFVRAVEEAFAWMRAEGGGFAVAHPHPSALLMRALLVYAAEVSAREVREIEESSERARTDSGAAQD